MKEKFKKIGRWTLIVSGTILATFFILGIVVDSVPSLKEGLQWGNYYNSIAPYTREENRLEALRKADVYGGKTPEETLNMYIEALKKGDIELASKYVVVEKQEETFERLNRLIQKGELENSIKGLEMYFDNKKECLEKSHCSFTYSYVTKELSTTTVYYKDKIVGYDTVPCLLYTSPSPRD